MGLIDSISGALSTIGSTALSLTGGTSTLGSLTSLAWQVYQQRLAQKQAESAAKAQAQAAAAAAAVQASFLPGVISLPGVTIPTAQRIAAAAVPLGAAGGLDPVIWLFLSILLL